MTYTQWSLCRFHKNQRKQHDWKAVHARGVQLSKRRAAYDHEEGEWLLLAKRAGVHLRLGYGSFFEYVDRLFGYSARETAERLRVASALKAALNAG